MPSVPLLVLICPTSPGYSQSLCFPSTSSNTFLNKVSVKNREPIQHQLTQSPTFHFLRRERKNRKYLYHNLNEHVRHSHSWCNANINLKPAKETFNAVEETDELVVASAGILCRLGAMGVKLRGTEEP
jgi:hypothetical protein